MHVGPLVRFVEYLLTTMPYPQAGLFFLVQNAMVFASALLLGAVLARRYRDVRVTPAPPPLDRLEVGLAASTVVLNAAITFAGLVLYREGIVTIDSTIAPLRVLRDVVVLVVVMDAAMYALHRVAHHPTMMRLLHAPHHRYEHPRPLTLFVLHPLETVSFGALWLTVIALYDATWLGIALFLTLNLLFGVVGHIGVEPTPSFPARPGLRWIATSSFHGGHHVSPATNFGFYTTVWDRLFGTLAADYDTR
jgi:sterol desaturase/sphingolipid hydroxylase (fatty acid hydroxylase superfamily)